MELNLHFNSLFARNFNQHQVKIKWQPDIRSLPDSLIKDSDAFWNREVTQTSKKSFLFNGDLCRLDGWEINEKNLTLHLGMTNYKELLYSNSFTQQITTHFNSIYLSAALGISAILISADEQIVLIKRSETVGEYPGKLDVVGGHIHPKEHAVSGAPDPFFAIKAEILEEVNLEITENDPIDIIGLIETRVTKKPELIFQLNCQQKCEEIKQTGAINNSSEISNFLSIANKRDALSTFLLNNTEQFSPSAIGSLWLYAQSMSGE